MSGLLHRFIPRVWGHLESHRIKPALYASKWFITIFCYEFPFEFVYRIWDCFLSEGIKFVFRVCLALIKMNEAAILKIGEFEPLMKFMQSIHSTVPDIESLLSKAFDLPLKHVHLEELQEKYDKMKLDKTRKKRRENRGRRDMQQPSIVTRLSQEAHTQNAQNAPNALNGDTLRNGVIDKVDDEDSASELRLSNDEPNGPDLNFEPKTPDDVHSDSQRTSTPNSNGNEAIGICSDTKSPSDEVHFRPQSPSHPEDEEKKEEDLDANCKRYDEGSHSESSQMHSDDSSSDPLASTKEEDHCESAEQQMASTSNATDCANLEANLDEENQNLIQNQMD